MSPNILFDNIVISDDPAAAADWAVKTYSVKMTKITKNEVCPLFSHKHIFKYI